jgi:hypothetical protein
LGPILRKPRDNGNGCRLIQRQLIETLKVLLQARSDLGQVEKRDANGSAAQMSITQAAIFEAG